jgi:hypothetical protein
VHGRGRGATQQTFTCSGSFCGERVGKSAFALVPSVPRRGMLTLKLSCCCICRHPPRKRSDCRMRRSQCARVLETACGDSKPLPALAGTHNGGLLTQQPPERARVTRPVFFFLSKQAPTLTKRVPDQARSPACRLFGMGEGGSNHLDATGAVVGFFFVLRRLRRRRSWEHVRHSL